VLLPVETLRPLHFSLLFLKVKVALSDVAGLAEAKAAAGTEAAEAGEESSVTENGGAFVLFPLKCVAFFHSNKTGVL
jgi:hypothetical protein